MDKYKVLVEKENIKILKKQNKIKVEINSELENGEDLLSTFENLSVFDIIGTLNTDLIERVKIDKDNNDNNYVILVINNINNNEDYECENKSYLAFSIGVHEKTDTSIKLVGNKNSILINKDHYEKIDIDKITIRFNLIGNKISLEIKVKYEYNTIPIYTENILGYILCKIFKRLLGHYKK
jgi:hypothetical protein